MLCVKLLSSFFYNFLMNLIILLRIGILYNQNIQKKNVLNIYHFNVRLNKLYLTLIYEIIKSWKLFA